MKVDQHGLAAAARGSLAASFRKALALPKPRPAPAAAPQTDRTPTRVGPKLTPAASHLISRPKAQPHAEAKRLATVRAEAHDVARAQKTARVESFENLEEHHTRGLLKSIAAELSDDRPKQGFAPEPGPLPAAISSPATPSEPPPPQTKAAQALALIERIETFVRLQRPALTLTLNNSLGAAVHIERTGPRAVTITFLCHDTRLPSETLSKLRYALEHRGLKVKLSVANKPSQNAARILVTGSAG